jgi:hypothetical protein
MATYIQNITDYVPQFQPFQPDLNFYNNVLQTKQTQYDSNYKQLNQVYGQYFYADLTHGENIQRKEELLKNIDVTLKKVSGLDLSLEQNLTQATQVFKPFYEDQYLMKDMAWTKNFNNQKGRAQGLKNSLDDKIRGQYWEDGVLALDYQREEFKESAIQDTLGISSPSYTNYVNVQEKALKLAKDSDLSIESVDFSSDGKWIVKTKNGQQLEEPLSKLFEMSLGSDPAIMEMYKTQAYVNRKNFSYSNAAQFNGDKNAAEKNYLETHFNRLKTEQVARHTQLQESSKVYTNKIKDIESQIANGNKDPRLVQTLNSLKENKGINESVLNRVQKDIDIMNDGKSSTATTTTGNSNPYGDLKSMRYKIDNAIASSLMEKDLDQAAHVFAYRNAKEDIEANPYAVLDQKHQYDMQVASLRNRGIENAAKIRNIGEREKAIDAEKMATGAYHRDEDPNSPTYGRPILLDELQGVHVRADHSGDVTGKAQVKVLNQQIVKAKTNEYAVEAINKMNELVDKYVSEGWMTEAEANHIYGSGANKNLKGMTRKEFQGHLRNSPNYFLNNQVGGKSLAAITARFNKHMSSNARIETVNKDMESWEGYGEKLNEFGKYQESVKHWEKEAVRVVEQELSTILPTEYKYLAKNLYKEDGSKLSKVEYRELRKKQGADESILKRPTDITLNGKQMRVTNENYDSMVEKVGAEKLRVLSNPDAPSWDFQKGSSYPKEMQEQYHLSPNKTYVRTLVSADTGLWKTEGNKYKFKEYNASSKKDIINSLGKAEIHGTFGKNVAGTGRKTFDEEYDMLSNAANKAWTSSRIKTPVSLSTIDVSRNAGSGLYTSGVNVIGVNHKAVGTAGADYWRQAKRDLYAVDWGDPSKIQTSFTGANQTGLSKSADSGSGDNIVRGTNSKSQTILNALMTDSENMKSDLPNFSIGAQRIAANNSKKGAMIVYPSAAWLKSYMDKNNAEGKAGDNIITQTDYNNMLQNGISIVQDGSNWTNQLYTKGQLSPLESIIDYRGSYQYDDMYGNGTVVIEKALYGSSKYKTIFTHIGYDDKGEKIVNKTIGYSNGNADDIISGTQKDFSDLNNYYNSY